jgi:hypothetical protein
MSSRLIPNNSKSFFSSSWQVLRQLVHVEGGARVPQVITFTYTVDYSSRLPTQPVLIAWAMPITSTTHILPITSHHTLSGPLRRWFADGRDRRVGIGVHVGVSGGPHTLVPRWRVVRVEGHFPIGPTARTI